MMDNVKKLFNINVCMLDALYQQRKFHKIRNHVLDRILSTLDCALIQNVGFLSGDFVFAVNTDNTKTACLIIIHPSFCIFGFSHSHGHPFLLLKERPTQLHSSFIDNGNALAMQCL